MRRGILVIASIVFLFLMISPILASTESDFLKLVNQERASLGKTPLYLNSNLTQAAYLHSKDMGDNNYFSHTSLDGTTFDKRIEAAGYTGFSALGENIAYESGPESASDVFLMWNASAGHYENMMGDYNEMGLGVYTKNGLTYYTQDLGKRPDNLVNKCNTTLTNTTNTTVPKQNSTNVSTTIPNPILTLSITDNKTITVYYKSYTILINTNKNSMISYKFNNYNYLICNSCSKAILYARVPIFYNYNINFSAKDTSGNMVSKDIIF